MPVEQIKHAAVKWQDGKITKGRDHERAFQKREGWRDEESPTCGFITSTSRFVDRYKADKIAISAGQVMDGEVEGGLQSEELWMYGSYEYDDEKGYYKDE